MHKILLIALLILAGCATTQESRDKIGYGMFGQVWSDSGVLLMQMTYRNEDTCYQKAADAGGTFHYGTKDYVMRCTNNDMREQLPYRVAFVKQIDITEMLTSNKAECEDFFLRSSVDIRAAGSNVGVKNDCAH